MNDRVYMKTLVLLCSAALFLFGWSAAQNDGADARPGPDSGQALYELYCAYCHQADGSGVDGQYPALDGSGVVTADPAAFLTFPLQGPGRMPAFAQTLGDEQLAMIATYVRSAWSNDAGSVDADRVAEAREQTGAPDPLPHDVDFAWRDLGEQVYQNNCAACHQADGTGIQGAYPSFVGNGFVLAEPAEVIALPLNGRGGMPSFRNDLDDEQLAAVLSYIRNAWDNVAPPISQDMVAELRAGGDEPPEEGARPGAAN